MGVPWDEWEDGPMEKPPSREYPPIETEEVVE